MIAPPSKRISPKQIRALGFTAHSEGLDRFFIYGETKYYVCRAPHPTALFPWYGIRPDGSLILAPSGYAFGLLRDALIATKNEAEKPTHKRGGTTRCQKKDRRGITTRATTKR